MMRRFLRWLRRWLWGGRREVSGGGAVPSVEQEGPTGDQMGDPLPMSMSERCLREDSGSDGALRFGGTGSP
jgi:hypothetical protein